MQTLFDAVGVIDGVRRLADAWHRRVMPDEVVAHASSHGYHPQRVERLVAYWAEAFGGRTMYSDCCGNETIVVKKHSGNGEHDEMDRRANACFDQALADIGLAAMARYDKSCTITSHGRPRQRCPATTNPPMTRAKLQS